MSPDELAAHEQFFADGGKLEPARLERGPVASHRSTTSSRHPGRAMTGTVWFHSALIRCPDCGAPVMDTVQAGQHAPSWRAGVLRNCVGTEVAP